MCVCYKEQVADLMKDIFRHYGNEAAVEEDVEACLISLLRQIKDKLQCRTTIETRILVGCASAPESVKKVREELSNRAVK